MDSVFLLNLIAGVSAAALLLRSVLGRPTSWDWAGVAALVLGLIAAETWHAGAPGYAGVVVWALLVVFPTLGSRGGSYCLQRQQYRAAELLSTLLLVTHPSRSFRIQRQRVRALCHWSAGRHAEAIEEYERLAAFGGDLGLLSRIEIARLRGDGSALHNALAEIRALGERATVALLFLELRVLGESGDIAACLQRFRDNRSRWNGPAAALLRPHVLLLLFAEFGHEAGVETILASQLRGSSREIEALWRGAARLAARGDHTLIESLSGSLDRIVARAAGLRKSRPAALSSAADLAYVEGLFGELRQQNRYRFGAESLTPPYATYGLAGAILLVFVSETALGGSTNEEVLAELGALSASRIVHEFEVWRLLAFLFLHYGVLHLLMNGIALVAIGPFVERFVGRLGFVCIYLLSGIAGGALFVARVQLRWSGDSLLVGASGCVMGLAGAMAAILLWGAYKERLVFARQRFGLVLGVLLLQTVLDAILPAISMLAHVTGMVFGFVATTLWIRLVTKPPRRGFGTDKLRRRK